MPVLTPTPRTSTRPLPARLPRPMPPTPMPSDTMRDRRPTRVLRARTPQMPMPSDTTPAKRPTRVPRVQMPTLSDTTPDRRPTVRRRRVTRPPRRLPRLRLPLPLRPLLLPPPPPPPLLLKFNSLARMLRGVDSWIYWAHNDSRVVDLVLRKHLGMFIGNYRLVRMSRVYIQ